ncbi:amino acid adenylation domain-containing protein [Nonomuraea sp. K274]|uniref:Amino acid adenylation domain-containing protein n=1 Tax=Nonomuraea cypriaca TaxID=1187855 RepID=A0A931AB44_9ACTN|nr:non-ribosomal peptide synthetase [Nonomuraea cypriaca]MBF8188608.1 amino acid adenylation domain-containing protein [Nonomuraea cypriaca]
MTLTELIEAQAAATPDAPALRFGDVTLTYAELDRAASNLAVRLRERGAGPERIVAVALERSAELVVALVAVLKTGAAYLPVDPDYPAERATFMLADAEPVTTLRTLTLDLAGQAGPGVRVDPRNPAYVIYTSGSTGRPKGVVVSHEAIVNRIRWMQAEYGLTAEDRVLQKTPSSFDVSVWEFFWPLVTGATLVVAEPGGHRDAAYLAALIQRERVTTVHFVPSMLRAFLADPDATGCTGLRTVICSGEALPAGLAAGFHASLPGTGLHNLYGPTEAAVDVTFWPCRPGVEGPVPIGRPVWNTTIHVLDQNLRPASYGELYIGGVQVARGYLRRPGLTAERFVPDPFGPPGARMYRTGDLARRRQDGVVEYAGRVDDQIKIRGFRVEPGEVEAALAAHPEVRQAVVAAREDRPGVLRLVGYVVPAGGGRVDPAELREHVAARLPAHMVPAAFVHLESPPLTANGKLDRRALPAPETEPASPTAAGTGKAAGGAGESVTPGARPGGVPGDGFSEEAADELVAAEETLARLFAEVLRLPSVSGTDDFFALGGDSILALHLVGRARRAGLAITARQVLDLGTVRALAAVAGKGTAAESRAAALGAVPATPIMGWLRERGEQIDHFAQSMTLRLPRDVDGDRLTLALQAVLDHHDLLRARLSADGLEVPPPGTVTAAALLREVPAGAASGSEGPGTVLPAVAAADGEGPGTVPASGNEGPGTVLPGEAVAAARAGLAPRDGVMVRAVWLNAGQGGQSLLHVVAHHLVVDGVSWRVLAEDLAQAYESGTPLVRSASFRTWARGLRALDHRAELPYWRETLTGAAAWDLDPLLDTTATSARLTLSARLDVSLDLVLAALAGAVAEHRARHGRPGGHELLVDVEGHGREDVVAGADLSRTVGWFTSISPVRLDSGSVDGVSRRLRAVPGKGVGYGLLRYLAPDSGAELARLPRPRICVNYLGRFAEDGGDWGMVLDQESFLDLADPGLPLAHALTIDAHVAEGPEGARLEATWTWAARLLPESVIRELADLWLDALTTSTPSATFLVGIDQEELDEFEETLA